MSSHVQVKEWGTGSWSLVPDANVTDKGADGWTIDVPVDGELGSRLTGAGLRKYLVIVGDMDSPEGVLPDLWRGVVKSWRPSSGGRLLLDVRHATTVEDLQG